jgi:hypothetical protein
MLEAGSLNTYLGKYQAVKLTTNAVVTVLELIRSTRKNQMVGSSLLWGKTRWWAQASYGEEPDGGLKPPMGKKDWDE